ncbi:hypothetical protein BJ508DRAFT_313723 [Ascobolus immersus RN42]|uniref:Uncharacterized protein n=1 Tax=Ascobolus immersus RN42 TaxID=1160509 RepID=A0A3N4HNX2_ASCIM|nr:hypothetical protein BJ508DRAFT_313723 [Ascobolus immersus RN42]
MQIGAGRSNGQSPGPEAPSNSVDHLYRQLLRMAGQLWASIPPGRQYRSPRGRNPISYATLTKPHHEGKDRLGRTAFLIQLPAERATQPSTLSRSPPGLNKTPSVPAFSETIINTLSITIHSSNTTKPRTTLLSLSQQQEPVLSYIPTTLFLSVTMSNPCDDQCKRELQEAAKRRDDLWRASAMHSGPHGYAMPLTNTVLQQQAQNNYNNDKNDIYARAAARKAEEDRQRKEAEEKRRYDSVPPEQREK